MSFGRLESSKKPEPMSEINVTPMVDVMLVLLVIFILTAPLLTSAIRLELPQGEGAQSGQAPQSVTLVVNAQGALYFNDQAVTPAELRTRLQDTARRNPDTEVQLRADQAIGLHPLDPTCKRLTALREGGSGNDVEPASEAPGPPALSAPQDA